MKQRTEAEARGRGVAAVRHQADREPKDGPPKDRVLDAKVSLLHQKQSKKSMSHVHPVAHIPGKICEHYQFCTCGIIRIYCTSASQDQTSRNLLLVASAWHLKYFLTCPESCHLPLTSRSWAKTEHFFLAAMERGKWLLALSASLPLDRTINFKVGALFFFWSSNISFKKGKACTQQEILTLTSSLRGKENEEHSCVFISLFLQLQALME